MIPTEFIDVYKYTINDKDFISSVSSNWDLFEPDIETSERTSSSAIVGHSIWNFIDGDETRFLYKTIFSRVRTHTSSVAIPYRCDSPTMRRFLELHLSGNCDGGIDLSSYIIREERRDKIDLFETNIDRNTEFIKVCSMCKKVAITDKFWAEVETAISILRLFSNHRLPQITHGLCPECYHLALIELDLLPIST